MPTFDGEEQLPRVPLPTLEESCARFLEWCTPLLTGEELAATTAAVDSFLRPDSPARALHAALEAYDASNDAGSWLDEFWADRYLGRRDRIALNANAFTLLADSGHGQVERAARLVAAIVDYKRSLDSDQVERDVDAGRGLSMAQHRYLFSTTRIPGPLRDTLRAPYSARWPGPSRERHVVVLIRGHIFRMDVIDPHGEPYPIDALMNGLRAAIEQAAAAGAPRPAVAHLTTMPRAAWAASRAALLGHHPRNAAALDTVETALFCVCVEASRPASTLEACDQLLHGDSANRWFDKSVSIVVFADGTAGLNVEHAGLDGATTTSFVAALAGRPAAHPERRRRGVAAGSPAAEPPAWEPVEFEVDSSLTADIAAAADSFAAAAADTATALLSLDDIGSAHVKRLGVSPDAFVQMAFQLAHLRARGFVGATYESVSTRHFRRGRVEAMRVVTPEVMRFVSAMESADHDDAARRTTFAAAAEAHVRRTKECQAGLAPEQHLWELQLIQRRNGDSLGVSGPLALYESPAWTVMRDDYLSTSTVPSEHVQYAGFGPTGNRCIGLAYMLLPDRFKLFASAPRPLGEEMHRFVTEVRRAFGELTALLAGRHRPGRGDAATEQ